VGVVVGGLVRGIGVGGDGIYVVCGYGYCWFVLFYVGMECGGVWGKIEAVYIGRGVPRSALKDAEFICVRWLYAGPTFPLGVDSMLW
jgi:hypothetical protein